MNDIRGKLAPKGRTLSMSVCTKSRALSSEEAAELERSNKKVKDVRHADFTAS